MWKLKEAEKENMIEINGVKFFEGLDKFREVKARTNKNCDLCNKEIHKGEIYYRYIEKPTGYEKKGCSRHLDEKIIKQFETKRKKYTEKRKRGEEIWLETDASGSEGERWAFIAYLNSREIFRERGYSPPEIKSITPAEGYAIWMAMEWLRKAEKEGTVKTDLPVVVGSDNYAVASKLDTQSERGGCDWLWQKLAQVLLPYRKQGRLFVEIRDNANAHNYAQKWE